MDTKDLIALCRQRTPASLIAFYEWIFRDREMTLPDHLLPVVYALCDIRISKLMLIIGPGAGKSSLLSIAYPAWSIGHDPSLTTLCVSGAENSANGFMQAIMSIIQHSPAWKLIFPEVTPNKDEGWGGERGMYVVGHQPGDPDPNFWGGGLTSRAITTKHARLMILDDVHSDENSATEEQCAGVVNLYYRKLLGRADPKGARFILAGRRFHQSDLYGHFTGSEDWVSMQLPAERLGEKNLYYDISVPDNIECVFTDRMVYCDDGQVVRV